ncbi:MAG: dTMP kinase [Candidatus Omnitrophota bacterium]
MAKKLTKGIFIAFEGPEGSGKSTHSRRIHEDLLSQGYDVIHTAEPGGTNLGEKLRGILLGYGAAPISVVQKAELLLFEADRAQHVAEVILPALEAKKIVLCDRFNVATFAYQGYGLGMDLKKIEEIDSMATGGLEPDLTLLMDIDTATGLARATANHPADKMEKRGNEFHVKVRQGYLELAKRFSDRISVIEVKDDKDKTYELVREAVYGLIERYTGTG